MTDDLRITAAWLRRHGACADQVGTFARYWPDGARVTLQGLRKAAKLGLDLDWLAYRILTPTQCSVWAAARAEANRVWGAAMAELLWRAYRDGGRGK